MVKHTQTICRQQPTNCVIVFDHFVRLALEGLMSWPYLFFLYPYLFRKILGILILTSPNLQMFTRKYFTDEMFEIKIMTRII